MTEHSSHSNGLLFGDIALTLEQYQIILEAARCCIFTLDDSHHFVSLSPSIGALAGYKADDLLGRSLFDFISPEWQEKVAEFWEQDSAQKRSFDYPLLTQFGRYIWVRHTRTAIQTEQGNFTQCLIQDISAEKEFTGNLEQEQFLLRTLLDNIPDFIHVKNPDGYYILSNIAHSKLLGADDPSELMGKRGADFLPTEMAQRIEEEDQMVMEGNLVVLNEERSVAVQSEQVHWLNETKVPLHNAQGEIIGLVGIARDVTLLKHAQEELKQRVADLDTLRQISSELADNLSVSYVVPMALDAILRLSRARSGFIATVDTDGSLAVAGLVGPYNAQQVQQLLEAKQGIMSRVVASKQAELLLDIQQEPDYAALLPDTQAMIVMPLVSHEHVVGVIQLETQRANRFNEERFAFAKQVAGRIASFLDNANLHRQTQEQVSELQRLYEEVRRLEHLKSDMIRIASHDLKNPLNAAMGYLDMLREDMAHLLEDRQRAYLDKVENSNKMMQRIITDILSLERIEQMAKQHNREILDIGAMLHKCVDEEIAKASEQQFFRLIPEERVLVQGDPVQLYEALSNLIGNAIKYTPDDGEIHISLSVTETMVQVRIQDSGYGIPTNQQERLFTPFYRAKTKETRKIQGSGLGLHLVNNIVQRHDGKIYFVSQYGAGSTFGFDLPIAEELD